MSRKGLSYHISYFSKKASQNKKPILTSSILIYVLAYMLIGLGGISFQSQPATGYLADPNQPTNPNPGDGAFAGETPQTVSISALYSDDDGHSGTLTFYDQSGTNLGSCYPNDGERCGTSWSASHGENRWYAVANDDGDDAKTRSDDWMFVINQPPDQTTSPDSPSDGSTVYSDSVELSAQVSDPDSDNVESVFYHNDSYSQSSGSHTSGSTASVSLNNLNRGQTYKWWMEVSDSWDTTKSSEWTFYVNELPRVYNPQPSDGGIITTDNPEISVQANDDNAGTLTAYFFNDSGDYLGKDEFSNGGEASTTYTSEVDIGETYTWTVNVSDGFENITRTYSFQRTTTERTRIRPGLEYRYSSIILSPSETRTVPLEVKNRIDEEKSLITYAKGVNAVFTENNQDSISYTLAPKSTRRFLIQIRPESTEDAPYLDLITENQNLGVNTTIDIPVTVKNYTDVSRSQQEVSGIGFIQIIMLLLVSAYLYSARL